MIAAISIFDVQKQIARNLDATSLRMYTSQGTLCIECDEKRFSIEKVSQCFAKGGAKEISWRIEPLEREVLAFYRVCVSHLSYAIARTLWYFVERTDAVMPTDVEGNHIRCDLRFALPQFLQKHPMGTHAFDVVLLRDVTFKNDKMWVSKTLSFM